MNKKTNYIYQSGCSYYEFCNTHRILNGKTHVLFYDTTDVKELTSSYTTHLINFRADKNRLYIIKNLYINN
jgi:hypothetical protein|nr:MAG TPA: hypothetical protein [Caudoviricetes sp.]